MKRQIFIKESELNALIYESVKCIISKSQESKSISAAKQLLIDKLGDKNKAEETLKTISWMNDNIRYS